MAEDRGACAGAKAPAPLFERVHFLHELDLQALLGTAGISTLAFMGETAKGIVGRHVSYKELING